MKTIEEQAREYAETKTPPECGYILTARNAFLTGAKAANRWIPVEEEPDDKDKTLIALDYRGGVSILFWGSIVGHNKIIQNDRRDRTFKYYTLWLPIPPMPEKWNERF